LPDGDTLTVLGQKQEWHKVRLTGIDAPEKSQPFGQRAKAYDLGS
jgi:endonuclease YncB( thermonuclease family)